MGETPMSERRDAWRPRSAYLAAAALALLSGCGGGGFGEEYRRSTEANIVFGGMRTERAPADAPYDRTDLVRNFEKVLFEHEAQLLEYRPSYASDELTITKWERDLLYAVKGDAATSADDRAVEEVAAMLSESTRLNIRPATNAEIADGEANLVVYIHSPRRRKALLQELDLLEKTENSNALLRKWLTEFEVPCMAQVYTEDDGSAAFAAVFLKGELVDPLRRSCFEEELAQVMGTGNDHDDVRPSLFNDRNEFALLTDHDQDLIRILYDPRLKSGMTRSEAMPIVREIVAGWPR